MPNDIEIRVRVGNQTGAGVAAVNTSLRTLHQRAEEAGRGLTTLAAKATAASAAMHLLHQSIQDVNGSLRQLNVRSNTTLNRLNGMSDRTRRLRGDSDDLDGSLRRLTGTLGGLRGSMGRLPGVTGGSSRGMNGLMRAALALTPALIPIGAAMVPLVGSLTAGSVALAAFAAATVPQIVQMAQASEAQKKWEKAVREHGKASQQAAQGESEYLRLVKEMPPATREAAAAFGIFKDEYKAWSKELSGDTMPVATKSFALFGAVFPKLTPAVKGASGELNRLMTVLAGGTQTPAFDRFMKNFSEFSTGVLTRGTDNLIHFMRVMAGGAGRSDFQEFLQYARENGPKVAETLGNVGQALTHLIVAASDTGVSVLTLVNALARLVNALPSGALANLMQVYLTFKLIKLAALGIGSARAGVVSLTAAIMGMRTASAAAGGGIAGLRAALATLSTGAKVGLVAAAIALLVVGIAKLSGMGKKAPPDVDRLTTALGKLAQTGKVTGEAARAFGSDLDGLGSALRTLARPSNLDKTQQFLTSLVGMDSTPVKKAKENLDAIDKALANMVRGGKADLAAQAFTDIAKAMEKQGLTGKELKGKLDDYQAAIADAAFEQRLAAAGMGLFGQQALETKAKLDAQKASADGLRQAIQALNDVNRQGLGGMIGFEAAIDAAAEAAKKNAGALRMSHGQLNLNSEKARDAASALNDLAQRTDEAASAARESGKPWSEVNAIYARGREQLIRSAQAMGLTRTQAAALAAQILKTPDKTAKLKGNLEDLQAKLKSAKAQLAKVPDSRKAKVQARIDQLQAAIRQAKAALASLRNKTVVLTTRYRIVGHPGGPASGTYYGSTAGRSADGNIYGRSYADGGREQHVAQIAQPTLRMWAEPETGGEAYIPMAPAKRPRSVAILQQVADDFGYRLEKFAGGGLTSAMRDARKQAWPELTVSWAGQKLGYRNSAFGNELGRPGSLGELGSALNKWRGIIKAATSGLSESRLLKQFNSAANALIRHEKALGKVNSSLEKARDKLASLKEAAAQMADSVKSGIIGGANITKTASASGAGTSVGSIIEQMTGDRDAASSFAAALKTLKGRGLNSQSLSEIAQAGVEGGGLATATALLRASKGDIKEINALEKQLMGSAGSAGKTTADAMYGAGIKAAEGMVRGLEKQKARLEKLMASVAKALEKAIERAFRHKAAGGIVGAASGGARGGLTMVGEQGPELAILPYGSTVRSNPDTRRWMAQQGGASHRPLVIHLSIGDREFGQIWVDTGRKQVRAYGGLKATLGAS